MEEAMLGYVTFHVVYHVITKKKKKKKKKSLSALSHSEFVWLMNLSVKD